MTFQMQILKIIAILNRLNKRKLKQKKQPWTSVDERWGELLGHIKGICKQLLSFSGSFTTSRKPWPEHVVYKLIIISTLWSFSIDYES